MATTKMSIQSACAYAYSTRAKSEKVTDKMITGTNKHPRVFDILEHCDFVLDTKRPGIDLIVYNGKTVGWMNTTTGVSWFDDTVYAKIIKTLPPVTENIDDNIDDGDHDN